MVFGTRWSSIDSKNLVGQLLFRTDRVAVSWGSGSMSATAMDSRQDFAWPVCVEDLRCVSSVVRLLAPAIRIRHPSPYMLRRIPRYDLRACELHLPCFRHRARCTPVVGSPSPINKRRRKCPNLGKVLCSFFGCFANLLIASWQQWDPTKVCNLLGIKKIVTLSQDCFEVETDHIHEIDDLDSLPKIRKNIQDSFTPPESLIVRAPHIRLVF